MKDLDTKLKKIKQLQNEDILFQELIELEKEIKTLFLKIKNCTNFVNSKKYFYILEKIQFSLAFLLFEKHIPISKFLHNFVKNFDRIDDVDLQKYLFKKLKTKDFHL